MKGTEIAINAAKIALYMSVPSDSTNTVDQIVMAAERLTSIENRRGFVWEEKPRDWESVCFSIAHHLKTKHRAPSTEAIETLILTKQQ